MRNDALLLAGRVLIAALFLPAAYQTLGNLTGAAAYFAGLSLPLPILAAAAVGVIEAVGGLSVLLGWGVRWLAAGLAAFCIAAAFIGHFGQGGDDTTLQFLHMQMFWKDIAIAGGLLALAAAGAGAYSLDARRR